ncbi:MAG: TetR/AcrR family transcriptional regulator [Sedimentisphaerales bacterium]|nr:TetR/AcrR family transcriptional regulator [Sedimentisphaerales bacterium]
MTTQLRGQKTQEDLLRTAGRLFAQYGYFATSTGDILDAVGLSKGAFYYHFKSKEDLAAAVLRQSRDDYETIVFAPVRLIDDPGRRLRQALQGLLQVNMSGMWDHCLLLARLTLETAQQRTSLTEQVESLFEIIHAFWREVITQAVGTEVGPQKLSPDQAARMLLSTWLGAIILKEFTSQTDVLQETAVFYYRLLTDNPTAEL